jgi:hypothetical protein
MLNFLSVGRILGSGIRIHNHMSDLAMLQQSVSESAEHPRMKLLSKITRPMVKSEAMDLRVQWTPNTIFGFS